MSYTEAQEKAIVHKVTWRIVPFVFLLYIISYLDRANIGYAALQMNAELALSSEAFGFISGIFFVYQCGSLGVGYWMPQIIKGLSESLSHFQIGLIAMLPYIVATVAMVLWSRNSDRHDERKLHSAIPLGVAAVALFTVGFTSSAPAAVALISVALAGLYAFKSPFWALPGLFLSRSTAAISIAVINSIGNLGGFVGPYLIGVIKGSTGGSLTGTLFFLSVLLLIAFLMTLFMRTQNQDIATPAASVT